MYIKNLFVKSKLSFCVKFALRSLLGNPSRTFVVFLGIFLGSYEYQYVLNELTDGKEYGGEPVIMSTLECEPYFASAGLYCF